MDRTGQLSNRTFQALLQSLTTAAWQKARRDHTFCAHSGRCFDITLSTGATPYRSAFSSRSIER
jgi:hypothetical protein